MKYKIKDVPERVGIESNLRNCQSLLSLNQLGYRWTRVARFHWHAVRAINQAACSCIKIESETLHGVRLLTVPIDNCIAFDPFVTTPRKTLAASSRAEGLALRAARVWEPILRSFVAK